MYLVHVLTSMMVCFAPVAVLYVLVQILVDVIVSAFRGGV